MKVEKETAEYMINKIGYLLPYYIQLTVEQCDAILYREKKEVLSNEDIDEAYETVLEENKNFKDWPNRLRNYFPEEFKFFFEVLTFSAHKGGIKIPDLFNIGVKHGFSFECKAKVDDVLVIDGYLIERDGSYFFLSPFLQDWWRRRFPEEILKPKK